MEHGAGSVEPPEPLRDVAQRLFGERLALASRYAHLLVTEGTVRGLIGPREGPRIWDRHLLNCAVVEELIEPNQTVTDVGSGAGLPGIVLAMARPDLEVILIESMARRCAFLSEVVADLGLARVTVVQARAEECARGKPRIPLAGVATARALGPLDQVMAWCLPLVAVGGRVLALKGESAAAEIAAHEGAIRRHGGGAPVLRRCGVGAIDPPTTVVEVVRECAVAGHKQRRRHR